VLILSTAFEATSRGHYGEESEEGKKGCEEEDRKEEKVISESARLSRPHAGD
jgi:hypothetical protein